MLKNVLNLGKVLSKDQQKSIQGGIVLCEVDSNCGGCGAYCTNGHCDYSIPIENVPCFG